MNTNAPTVHRGHYYFPSFESAHAWAKTNNWPTEFIREYGRGWAIQSGKSGNYAGPGEVPKQFLGWIVSRP